MAQLSTGMMDAGKRTIPDDSSRFSYGVRITTIPTVNVSLPAQTWAILMPAPNTWRSAGVAIRYRARSPTKQIVTMPAVETRLRPAAGTAYAEKAPS